MRAKRDVEMMRAGKTLGGGAGQGLAHHAAERGLDHLVVSQKVFHDRAAPAGLASSEVGGFCCPVPPEPRVALGFHSRWGIRPRVPHVPCYRWHVRFGPISAVPCRATAHIFTTRVDPNSPPKAHRPMRCLGFGGGAGY